MTIRQTYKQTYKHTYTVNIARKMNQHREKKITVKVNQLQQVFHKEVFKPRSQSM